MSLTRYLVVAAALAVTQIPAVQAEGLGMPAGEVVLTVTGDLPAAEPATLDLEMLKALGEVTYKTSTPWTEGIQEFTGTPLQALVDALGITEGSLALTAINDYAVDFPISEIDDGPIIAYLRNGEPMSVREKGPLWIIFPYDASEDYRSELVYSRSIWQLDRIAVSD